MRWHLIPPFALLIGSTAAILWSWQSLSQGNDPPAVLLEPRASASDVALADARPLPTQALTIEYPTVETSEATEAVTHTVQMPRAQLTMAEVDMMLLAAGWPVELLPEARAIAWCESRWRPKAIGDNGAALGLFQIHWRPADGWDGWFAEALEAGFVSPEEYDDWADPIVNARVARYIWLYHGAWSHWSCRAMLTQGP